ncbi:SET and MYND domain-containing protein DDB_G0273589 [Culex quinquefasciatus]|uniref:SET and MYND domain-containing protein DDB_G0273589 n=1 Tax=Culex quinquefasciatus TaxID=7176 RepID=UPI0018E3B44C|nr:SET and MYND domain-containing protein DDB_G0273589 [Culex quinquefasciatus]XP_038121843.1 SET and MYND domain-containing protein DDB_G0273589 [Culex quinquefasciatus]
MNSAAVKSGPGPETVAHLQSTFSRNMKSGGELDLDADALELIKFVETHGQLDKTPELVKSNAPAAEHRSAGNRLYRERKLNQALVLYNESICHAEAGSDQLAMGYANRSAVYFEQGEYEFALYNIDLAKRNNYPEQLMPKLLARELNCQQQIAAGRSKPTVPHPRMNINVDINPEIPFLASGIGMNYEAKFGRGLIAQKDFNPGDILLDEKVELCGLECDLIYQSCSQCSGEFGYSLIPCPGCPLAMFCSKECQEMNWKLYHRFECGVASKLCCISFTWGMIIPRFFFYGLTQFGDDLQAMMDYCEQEHATAPNPLERTLNQLEVFKFIHNAKPHFNRKFDSYLKVIVVFYYVVFLMNPLVRSVICTESHERFFLRSLLAYSRLLGSLLASTVFFKVYPQGYTAGTVSLIGSICNHSCDPAVNTVIHSGRVKMVVLRPIRKGEQIFTTYGTSWWEPGEDRPLDYKCRCVVCDRGPAGRKWHSLMMRPFPLKELKNVQRMRYVLDSEETNNAAKLNALQQLIKRYAHLHPQKNLGDILRVYDSLLNDAVFAENEALARARLHAACAAPL